MGVTSRRQGKLEGRETSLLEAQLEPAPASQRSRRPKCRELSEGNGVLGQADTGSQSCPYLASSHPLAGQVTGLITEYPLHFSSPDSGDLRVGVTGRERVQTLTLCVLETRLGLAGQCGPGTREGGPAHCGEGSPCLEALGLQRPGHPLTLRNGTHSASAPPPTAPSPPGEKDALGSSGPSSRALKQHRRGAGCGDGGQAVKRGRPSS